MRSAVLLVVASLVAPALVAFSSPPAQADGMEDVARLPAARYGASAVWNGTHAFLFGGIACVWGEGCGASADILRFDPASGRVDVMAAKLPTPRAYASAVWTGSEAYVLGGAEYNGALGIDMLDGVLRYDPANDTLDELPATLPRPVAYAAAVWTGAEAILFGGCREWGASCNHWDDATDAIQRFSPANGTVGFAAARLPLLRQGATAFVDGDVVRVMSGEGGCYPKPDYYGCRVVVTYDPVADVAEVSPHRLVAGTVGAVAFFDGHDAYLIGGQAQPTGASQPGVTNGVTRYTPATGEAIAMSGTLPEPWRDSAIAYTGEVAYVFGGFRHSSGFRIVSDAIHRYDTVERLPTEPRDVHTLAGPGVGEITLKWAEPSHHDSISGYRVFAADAGQAPALVAELGPDARSFVDAGHATGARRDYLVTAVNHLGEGPAAAGSGQTPVLPGAPRDLVARTAACLGGVDVYWKAPEERGGTTWGYRVYRTGPGGVETLVDEVAPTMWPRWYLWDRGLDDASTYAYRVAALNVVGEGPASEPVAATTGGAPSAPLHLDATPGPGRGEATLTWRVPSVTWCAPTSYRVWGDDGNGPALLAETEALSFTHSGLGDGVTTSYQVVATNRAGASEPSAVASARTAVVPEAPLDVLATEGRDAGQVKLTWTAPDETGGIAHTYVVHRTGTNEPESVVAHVPGPSTGYVDSGLVAGVEYAYSVVLENEVGAAAPTWPTSAKPAVVPRVHERQVFVVLASGDPTPSDAEISNGGRVTFVAASPGWNPRDAGTRGDCFDFVSAYRWAMRTGETFDLDLQYDPLARILTVHVPFDGSTRTCDGDVGEMTPFWVDVPVLVDRGWDPEPDLTIRVWA